MHLNLSATYLISLRDSIPAPQVKQTIKLSIGIHTFPSTWRDFYGNDIFVNFLMSTSLWIVNWDEDDANCDNTN